MKLSDFLCEVPVYIINLSDSVDRRNHVLNEFKGYDHLQLIEAIDGRDPHIFKQKYQIKYSSPHKYTTALIAVVCSHIKAIKMAYDNKLEKVCVFEDDVHTD